MKDKELDRGQLKLLAIAAMVVDHTAWGFVDFMSPLGQIMHIFGRLTVPIMCFFVAEGYRHTKDLKRYISRMITFSVLSVVPFYLFFHEEYDLRQNIIFDLLLALLSLCAAEHKTWPKPLRACAIAGLMIVSMAIGGWVIMPIIYVLVFYYGRDFKTKAAWFSFFTILMVAVLSAAIILNQQYHFSKYNWTVEERLYLIGFILALIPLSMYKGKKGRAHGGRYFFYIFYPAHFLVLYSIKYLNTGFSWEKVYVYVHIVSLLIGIVVFCIVLVQPVSRAQMAVSVSLLACVMYVFGFLLEITCHEVPAVLTATRVQYFAEGLVMMGATFCVQELCHFPVPGFIYAIEAVVWSITMYGLFTYPASSLMYGSITINTTAGSFPRMEIEGYGPAFYLFLICFVFVCILLSSIGIYASKNADKMQRKRLRCLFFAMMTMWLAYFLKPLNLTNGYEIPALFIPMTACFMYLSLSRYSYLDSVTLDFTNAINKGRQGIIAVDNMHRIMYFNEWVFGVFGSFGRYDDTRRIGDMESFLSGEKTVMEKDGMVYEFRVEPLIEQGYHTGKILWIIDMTEHYRQISEIEEGSTHDDLTDLHTRQWFEESVVAHLSSGGTGAFFITDMDNFKGVNDNYGHQTGDVVLKTYADVVRELGGDSSLLSARLGGDEFCLFYPDCTDEKELLSFAKELSERFDIRLKNNGHAGITSISAGIAISTDMRSPDYNTLYERADKALYESKSAGKNTCRIYH